MQMFWMLFYLAGMLRIIWHEYDETD